MSFYIVLILWLCFLMCHGYKWNLEINTVWIWNAVSEFVLVKENLYFWMFIFYKCQKTTMKLVICLYLASCHKAWPEFSEVWPQLQEFVSKCYPAAAELKMREISFLLRPQLHLVFFFSWWPLHQWGLCSVLLLELQFAKLFRSHLLSYWNNNNVIYSLKWSERTLYCQQTMKELQ